MEMIIGFTLIVLAGFLNNFSGGGKFVQLPAIFLISPGMIISEIIGLSKITSLPLAFYNLRDVKQKVAINVLKFIPILFIGMLISFTTTFLFLSLNEVNQKIFFVLFLSFGFLVSIYFKSGIKEKINSKFSFLTGFALCSFYEGVLGAGNGSLIIYLLKKYRAKSNNEAIAISRVLTLGLMMGSLMVFIRYSQIEWVLALPLAGLVLVGDLIGKMSKEFITNYNVIDKITTGISFVSCALSGYLIFA